MKTSKSFKNHIFPLQSKHRFIRRYRYYSNEILSLTPDLRRIGWTRMLLEGAKDLWTL